MNRLVGALLAVVLTGCGGSAAQHPSVSAATNAGTSPSATASPTPGGAPTPWPRYVDSSYHFSVSYPADFAFEPQHGVAGTGLLMAYRAIDKKYVAGYPAGQCEIAIYAKDADSLSAWVAKHTGSSTSSMVDRYFTAVSNQRPVTVAGREGLAFDWVGDQGSPTIHARAVFHQAKYVFQIQWFSADPAYATTVEAVYRRMLDGLELS